MQQAPSVFDKQIPAPARPPFQILEMDQLGNSSSLAYKDPLPILALPHDDSKQPSIRKDLGFQTTRTSS